MDRLQEPSLSQPTPDVKSLLAKYREPSTWKSTWQLLSSVLLFGGLWTLMLFSLKVSYALTLLLSIPTGGLLVRLFILQHDCGHGAFFRSKRLNDVIGFVLGVLVLTPYSSWRRQHALHHATAGDLDRRGHGDVHLLTVGEYRNLTPWKQFCYRVLRHPAVLFGVAPMIYFAVMQRFTYSLPRPWHQERVGVYATNLMLVACIVAVGCLIGFQRFVLVHVPVVCFASSVGVWLFYVQHNFETTYWQRHDHWDFHMAGISGSSYYQLPRVLQWMTANIGFHHIHHLDSRIPNYRLQKCFEENAEFQRVNRLTLSQSLSCLTLKLWDEDAERMVGFRELNTRKDSPEEHKPLPKKSHLRAS